MCLIKEVWKDIEGYEGLYQVSNMGQVKSLERVVVYNEKRKAIRKERIMKLSKDKDGYLRVNLCKDKENKNFMVHRLMAQSFNLPNNNVVQNTVINHINENPEFNFIAIVNNEVISSSIEWTSILYNSNYATTRIRSVEKRSKKVLQFTLDNEFVAEYPSLSEAKRKLKKTSDNCIGGCCRGERRTAYGFIWKYKE